MNAGKTYGIDVSFGELQLPLSHDVLILARNSVQGKLGLGKSLDLLAPGAFQAMDTDLGHEHVEAIFVNRKLLTKIPAERVIQALQRYVFEHISEGELIQVDMKVRISINNISS